MIGDFWDFISREHNIFGSWNLACGNLSASQISMIFFDLKFRPERRHLVTQLSKLTYTPIKAPIGDLFLLVTFDPRRFKICRPGSEFYSPRPFQIFTFVTSAYALLKINWILWGGHKDFLDILHTFWLWFLSAFQIRRSVKRENYLKTKRGRKNHIWNNLKWVLVRENSIVDHLIANQRINQ